MAAKTNRHVIMNTVPKEYGTLLLNNMRLAFGTFHGFTCTRVLDHCVLECAEPTIKAMQEIFLWYAKGYLAGLKTEQPQTTRVPTVAEQVCGL